AFASGMAAIATVLELLDAGSHIVAMHDLYGGSYRLLENVRKRSAGHRVSFVDLSDPTAFAGAIRPDTRLVWVESPTNPLLKLVDLSAVPGPFDAFLTLRGIKTLALRMERHCANALAVAQFLERHPRVERVYYPGLASHPQHALARAQMAGGFGGIVTAVLRGGLESAR